MKKAKAKTRSKQFANRAKRIVADLDDKVFPASEVVGRQRDWAEEIAGLDAAIRAPFIAFPCTNFA